jgi:hypothetical protein
MPEARIDSSLLGKGVDIHMYMLNVCAIYTGKTIGTRVTVITGHHHAGKTTNTIPELHSNEQPR